MDQVIFFMLVVLIALPSVVSGSIESWWSPIFESAILMLAAFSIVASNSRDWLQAPAVVMPMIGLMVFGCIQILPLWRSGNHVTAYEAISSDPFETKRFIVKLLLAVIILAMLSRYTANRERLMILMNVIVIIGALSALCAILRFGPAGSANDLQSGLQEESFGQFANKNHFALLMEMSIGPTVALVYLAGTQIRRVLCTVALLLMIIALLSANSRGGFFSLAAQGTLLAWIVVRAIAGKFFGKSSTASESWGKRLLFRGRLILAHSALLLCLFVTVGAGFLWVGGERVRQRLETVPDELLPHAGESQSSSTRRLAIWSATLGLITVHPFLGSGLGAYKTAISGHFRPVNEWRPQQAHNEYLELVAGAGVVGAVLGLWFLAVTFREIKRRLSEDVFRRVVCLGGAVGLVGVAIHSLVDFGLHVMANWVIFTVLIALATFRFSAESERARELARVN